MAKSNGGKAGSLNRDQKGRWLAKGKTDPGADVIQLVNAETEKLSEIYLEILNRIGVVELMDFLEIQKGIGGEWNIGFRAGAFFLGLQAGILFAEKNSMRVSIKELDDRKIAVMELLHKGSEIRENIGRLDRKWRELRREDREART